MKLFVNAILSVVMFASTPVFAATGLRLKKDIVFAGKDYEAVVAGYGKSEDDYSLCWVVSYRYGSAAANGVIPAGTVFPILRKESSKVFPNIEGGTKSLWQINTTVYSSLGGSQDSVSLLVQCADAYHLFKSFPNANKAISLFPDYVEEVELN